MVMLNKEAMLSFECELFGSENNIARWCNHSFARLWSKLIARSVAPGRLRQIPGKIMDSNPNLKSFEEYGRVFKEAMKGPFFAGHEPGPADLHLWSLPRLAQTMGM